MSGHKNFRGGQLELRAVFPDQIIDLMPSEARPAVAKEG